MQPMYNTWVPVAARERYLASYSEKPISAGASQLRTPIHGTQPVGRGGERGEGASGRRKEDWNIWNEKPVCSFTGNVDKERLGREHEQVLNGFIRGTGEAPKEGSV